MAAHPQTCRSSPRPPYVPGENGHLVAGSPGVCSSADMKEPEKMNDDDASRCSRATAFCLPPRLASRSNDRRIIGNEACLSVNWAMIGRPGGQRATTARRPSVRRRRAQLPTDEAAAPTRCGGTSSNASCKS